MSLRCAISLSLDPSSFSSNDHHSYFAFSNPCTHRRGVLQSTRNEILSSSLHGTGSWRLPTAMTARRARRYFLLWPTVQSGKRISHSVYSCWYWTNTTMCWLHPVECIPFWLNHHVQNRFSKNYRYLSMCQICNYCSQKLQRSTRNSFLTNNISSSCWSSKVAPSMSDLFSLVFELRTR